MKVKGYGFNLANVLTIDFHWKEHSLSEINKTFCFSLLFVLILDLIGFYLLLSFIFLNFKDLYDVTSVFFDKVVIWVQNVPNSKCFSISTEKQDVENWMHHFTRICTICFSFFWSAWINNFGTIINLSDRGFVGMMWKWMLMFQHEGPSPWISSIFVRQKLVTF